MNSRNELWIDFAIVTALPVEREAVGAAFGIDEGSKCERGGRTYWRGRVPLPGRSADDEEPSYEIVIAQAADMGNVSAAVLTDAVLRDWNPRAALLVGIAATAQPDKVKLGDVVFGRAAWYLEHGKLTPAGKAPEPAIIPAHATLAEHFFVMEEWSGIVPVARPTDVDGRSKAHFSGPILSVENVVASEDARNRLADAHRKIFAIAMEGYGFSYAISKSRRTVPHAEVRGICDEASSAKDDNWHKYAARAAAEAAKYFIHSQPISAIRYPDNFDDYVERVYREALSASSVEEVKECLINLGTLPAKDNAYLQDLRGVLEEAKRKRYAVRAVPELRVDGTRPLRSLPLSSYLLLAVVTVGVLIFSVLMWRR